MNPYNEIGDDVTDPDCGSFM